MGDLADLLAFSQLPDLGTIAAPTAAAAPTDKPALAALAPVAQAPFLHFHRKLRQRALHASQSPVSCRYHRRADTSHTPLLSTSSLYHPKVDRENQLTS
jgi:hypothetical protein